MATPAYAKFATRLLDIAAGEQDMTLVANALEKLQRLVLFDLLPAHERPRLIATAARYLAGSAPPIVWLAAVELAVATRDDRLRATVAAIASGTTRPSFTDHIDLGLWVRAAAQRALSAAAETSRAVSFA
jgi:hypothetical protein